MSLKARLEEIQEMIDGYRLELAMLELKELAKEYGKLTVLSGFMDDEEVDTMTRKFLNHPIGNWRGVLDLLGSIDYPDAGYFHYSDGKLYNLEDEDVQEAFDGLVRYLQDVIEAEA